jgi:hypothetical protein
LNVRHSCRRAVSKIAFDRDRFRASVEGRIEGHGRNIQITGIHVHYELVIPAGRRTEAERAVQVHPEGCPARDRRLSESRGEP